MTDYSLRDNFTVTGEWWLPESPDDRHHGTLVQTDGEPVLSLLEAFRQPEQIVNSVGEMHVYPVVHGTTAEGEAMTLVSAYSGGQGVRFSSGGVRRPEQLFALHLVVGAWLPLGTPLNDLSVRIPGLEVWLARQSISRSMTTAGVRRSSYTFTAHEAIVTSVPVNEFRLEWGWAFRSNSNSFSSVRLDVNAGVKIIPTQPQPLDWYLTVVSKLTSLLTLLGGVSMPVDQILATVIEGERSHRLYILGAMRLHEPCGYSQPREFFLTHPALSIDFEVVIRSWFGLPPALDQTIELARSVLASTDLWSHIEFLSLIQALEGTHRGTQPGLYMAEDDYGRVRSALAGAIPADLATDHKEALRSRIRYGNQVSLSRRLTFLARQFGTEIRERIFGAGGAVPRRWIDTRNYYTHWDEQLRPEIVEGQEQADALVRMRSFLRVTLLHLAGIPETALLAAFGGTSHVARHLEQVSARSRAVAARLAIPTTPTPTPPEGNDPLAPLPPQPQGGEPDAIQ